MRLAGDKWIALVVIVLLASIALSLLIYVPTRTPWSPYNTYSSGLSELVSLGAKPSYFSYRGEENYSGTTLFIIVLRPLPNDKIREYIGFVESGGTLVIFDDEGYSNTLLTEMGVSIAVVNKTVLDEVYKYGSRSYVKARYSIGGVSGWLALYKPGYLRVGDGVEPIASTSEYSYVDTDRNGYYTHGEPMGPLIVAASSSYGRGRIIVIADKDIVLNSVIALGGNRDFIGAVARGETILDLSTLPLGPVDSLKYNIDTYMRATEPGAATLLVIVASMVVGYVVRRRVYEG